MPSLTISLSDKEMHRLEERSKREGLTMEQMVSCCIRDLIAQPDEFFQVAAKQVMEKNAEFYRRLS
jgi:Ribbon-helix-helix protein, copG family